MTTTELKIRYATLQDAAAILKIYEPFITSTSVTFEYTVPSLEEFTKRVEGIMHKYPYFVCVEKTSGVEEEVIVGYAYANKFRERAAYNWDVESSIYVDPQHQRKGVATVLYGKLLDECQRRGFHNVVGGITMPNDHSVKLHEKFGFRHVGVFRKSGFKQGAWHDVLFVEKNINPCDGEPREILWSHDIKQEDM